MGRGMERVAVISLRVWALAAGLHGLIRWVSGVRTAGPTGASRSLSAGDEALTGDH